MRIGGGLGAHPVLAAMRRRIGRVTRTPAFGLAVIGPLVFTAAVGASAPQSAAPPMRKVTITPLAATTPPSPRNLAGPAVVSVSRPPSGFRVAAASRSAPPPAVVVSSPGMLGIPAMALAAYRNAEQMMAAAFPDCGVSWNLLAGIGRIESMHANGGATDARGTAIAPIYGPALDGSLPGNEVIVQSSTTERVVYARAMGPMQFLPGTWARYASDGDGDGQADPQNLYDSTLAAARYLCSGGLNLRDQSQVLTAILRYNNSMPYASNVLGWAAAYATGVIPVNLPPITGPTPPIGDVHLEHPEGLGPSLPLNHNGLPPSDPLARIPLIDLSGVPDQATQSPFQLPWLAPQPQSPTCSVICIESQPPPPASPLPPFAAPAAPDTPAPAAPDDLTPHGSPPGPLHN